MRTLNRYIQNQVILSTALVILILLGLESFMELVNQLSFVGRGHYGLLQAFIFVPMQLPSDLYQLFPMAGFLGSLIGLGRLASSSQLVVMRSAGVSVSQIAWSVIKAALWMLLFVTIIGEWAAPILQNKAVSMRDAAMHHMQSKALKDGVWLRKDNQYIHIAQAVSNKEVEDVMRFDFNDSHQLIAIIHANKAVLSGHQWQMQDITETRFTSERTEVLHKQLAPLGIAFKPKLLSQTNKSAVDATIFNLWSNIQYRKQAGLVASQFEYTLWQRLLQPITTVVMILLGIPFIFGSLRSASMGSRIIVGVIIGFGFYMLNQFFGPITLVYQFPPLLAATMPTLLFLFIYAIMLRWVR